MYTKLPPSTNSLQESQHIKNSHLTSDQGSPIHYEWAVGEVDTVSYVPCASGVCANLFIKKNDGESSLTLKERESLV